MEVEDVEEPICLVGCKEDADCNNFQFICHAGMLWYCFIIVRICFIRLELVALFAKLSPIIGMSCVINVLL